MVDFRYHALSLVAVFLALGIGIVLGASLGDSVVSEANKDVRVYWCSSYNGVRAPNQLPWTTYVGIAGLGSEE